MRRRWGTMDEGEGERMFRTESWKAATKFSKKEVSANGASGLSAHSVIRHQRRPRDDALEP
jgi:hypothetical protein